MIETERLLLRKPTQADVEDPPPFLSDPRVMDFLGGVGDPPGAVVQLWVDGWDTFPAGKLIVETAAGERIGRVGFNFYDPGELDTLERAGRAAGADVGARVRALGQGLRDRVRARRARVAGGSACDLADRPGQRRVATRGATARRDAGRVDRVARLRPARRLDASPMIETERLVAPQAASRGRTGTARGATPIRRPMRYIGDGSTTGRSPGRERGRTLARPLGDAWGVGMFVVERAEDGRVLGRAGFVRWIPQTWEIGGRRRSSAGCSRASTGDTATRRRRRSRCATGRSASAGSTRLISLIQHGNVRSFRVAEKLGERYERDVEVRGKPTPALLRRAMTELRPLVGTRVVDVTSSLAGPTATQLLAALGADVVKVEPLARRPRPRLGTAVRARATARCSSPRTRASARSPSTSATTAAATSCSRLADRADVFVQSLRPGAAERHGLGAAELRARNPRLVYCSIGAFGSRGPLSDAAGLRPADAGRLGDHERDRRGRPAAGARRRVADRPRHRRVGGARRGRRAVRARAHRHRPHARGLALRDRAVPALVPARRLSRHRRAVPGREGSAFSQIAPYQVFPTRDGELMIVAGNDKLFAALCRRPRRARADGRRRASSRIPDRVANRPALLALLAGADAGARVGGAARRARRRGRARVAGARRRRGGARIRRRRRSGSCSRSATSSRSPRRCRPTASACATHAAPPATRRAHRRDPPRARLRGGRNRRGLAPRASSGSADGTDSHARSR